MSAGKKRQLKVVQDLASRLLESIGPACQRVEIAGSVRRQVPMVGDIELVAIDRKYKAGLFGDLEESALEMTLASLVAEGRIANVKNGDRYKQFIVGRGSNMITLDLWIVQHQTWGVQLAIRTGPEEYSRAIVTQRCKGGLLRDGLIVKEGRVWTQIGALAGDRQFPDWTQIGALPGDRQFPDVDGLWSELRTPEESDFLALAGGWVEPAHRGHRGRSVTQKAGG